MVPRRDIGMCGVWPADTRVLALYIQKKHKMKRQGIGMCGVWSADTWPVACVQCYTLYIQKDLILVAQDETTGHKHVWPADTRPSVACVQCWHYTSKKI